MTIIDFCKKYTDLNSEKAKEQMLRSHIKRTYCPVLEKRMMLQMMLDRAKATSDDGIRYIDMMVSKINYTLGMIVLYTDLTVDKKEIDGKEVGANYECYDALISSGVLAPICGCIGENEMQELSNINSMLIDNFEKTEGSLCGFLSRTMSFLGSVIKDVK